MRHHRIFFMLAVVTALTAAAGDTTRSAPDPPLPWLGMGVRPERNPDGQRFLYVERVVSGGPSDRAGLQPADIITSVGGTSLQIGDDLDFLLFLADQKPGRRLRFRLVRAGQQKDVVVIVGTMPESRRDAWNRSLQVARQKRVAAQRR